MPAHFHSLDETTTLKNVKGALVVSGEITEGLPKTRPHLFGFGHRVMARPMKEASFWEAFCAVNSPVECLPPPRFVVDPNALDAILRNRFQIRKSFQKALLESGALEGAGSHGHR